MVVALCQRSLGHACAAGLAGGLPVPGHACDAACGACSGKEGCVPWLVGELGNTSTHWCTRAELAAVLGSLARIPALSAAMVRHALQQRG